MRSGSLWKHIKISRRKAQRLVAEFFNDLHEIYLLNYMNNDLGVLYQKIIKNLFNRGTKYNDI